MASSNENTPLISYEDSSSQAGSHTGHVSSSYYFLDRNNSGGDGRSVEGGGGSTKGGVTHSVIDTVPEGAASEDFDSRPVMHGPGSIQGSKAQQSAKPEQPGFFQQLFGKKAAPFQSTSVVGTVTGPRKAPIKVEPKVFFSNERTFLAWLHVSVILAGASVAIAAFADANPWSQLYGVLLLPVAIAFICYAMYQYARRANMIRRKDPGPYEDLFGPTCLGIILMISIIAQFSIKLYEIM
mmetsp:Transcript_3665/g.4950  ORF Transcript_3665/g.4950 Transcript_3665/m.4950 type:complete len:239 (-) Transcript_3665:302-1018(-)|eukprot:CAMPEP_0185728540 /NCGR_PEP_ID=MMETSP1171-20130828/3838_1 /TAXON_ID=374046 /ORGANISM="Helicotheca tamensis, Strain CCMP826" /LENGTH=238 /DNA_ID=CAMNT_0028397257 /DNA_START=27 /DNA_END=743 /DNA_ORIENTATION=-